jgi:WD40 repeat protein
MVMYETYTGKHLFAGLGERELVARVLVEQRENAPVFEKPTPQGFADLVARAIAKSREIRFPSMTAFLRELDTCIAEAGASPSRHTGTTGRFRPRLVASRGDAAAPRVTELKAEWRDEAATKPTPPGPAPQLEQQVQEVRERTSVLRDATSSVKGRHRDRAERGWRRAERLLAEGNLPEAKTSFEEAATLFSALTARVADDDLSAGGQAAAAPARDLQPEERTLAAPAATEARTETPPDASPVPVVAAPMAPAASAEATVAAPAMRAASSEASAPARPTTPAPPRSTYVAPAPPATTPGRSGLLPALLGAGVVVIAGAGIYLAMSRGGGEVAPVAQRSPAAQVADATGASAPVAAKAAGSAGVDSASRAAPTAASGENDPPVKLAVIPPAPTRAAEPVAAAPEPAPPAASSAPAEAVAAARGDAGAGPAAPSAEPSARPAEVASSQPPSAPVAPQVAADLDDTAKIVRFTRNPTVDIDVPAAAGATVTLDDRPLKVDRGRVRGSLTGLPVGASRHALHIVDAKGASEEIPVVVTYYPAWEMRRISDLNGEAYAVAFSPDGTRVFAGTRNNVVKMWDVGNGALVRTFSGHKDWVNDIAISPDGKTLVSGSKDRTLKLWDIETGAELRTLAGHKGWVNGVAFSPDGKQVASVSDDQTVKVWDVASGALAASLNGHNDWILAVAFSPDGKLIASAGRDKVVKLWDVATGSELRTLSGHTDWVNAVAFSPDGKLVASASDDRRIKLWEVATGKTVKTLSGHGGWVVGVAFSPDGTRLISASKDQTVRLWDVASGQEVRTFSGHQGLVGDVAFSPDGASAVSGGRDRTLRVWWTGSESPQNAREVEKGRDSG